MTKDLLRKKYREARAAMGHSEAARISVTLAEKFFDNVALSNISTLQTYIRIAKFNEIDTSIIYFRLWRDFPDIETLSPRIDASGNIESVLFRQNSELVQNKWGIREPVASVTVTALEIDLVIVPLLCFDERGNRVGYGKGMYDRFLAKCRPDCLKVGLSYFGPVEVISDAGEYDVTLDLCITPNEVFRWNKFETSEAVTCLAS